MTKKNSLACRETGQGNSTVVLLHGLFGQARNLGRLARELGEQHYVVAMDLPGHGESPHEPHYTIESMAASVQHSLRQRGIARYKLLGHSLGGKVAMAIALGWPDEVQRLLVADIAPVRYPPRHAIVLEALARVDIEALASRDDADSALAQTLHDSVLRQFLLQNLARAGGGYAWKFDLAGLQASYAALSDAVQGTGGPAFSGPALFVGGDRSDYILPEYEPAVRALFPAAQFQSIANSGHWLHAEQPVAFAEIAGKFFAAE
ncbi:MAG: alpha/beta fold hydrolase [Pseudomonadales bacterium]